MQRRGLRGATLIEMLVVLAILGGTAAIATLALRQPPGAVLDTNLRVLAADLRLARGFAMATGRDALVVFDADSRRLRGLDGQIDRQFPAALAITVTGSDAVRDDLDRDQIAIVFYPDGSTSGAEFAVQAGPQTGDLTLHWLTGEVRHARR